MQISVGSASRDIADQGKRGEDGLVEVTTLCALLRNEGCLMLLGVHDGISAKMAVSVSFDALYMTGYGVVAASDEPGDKNAG